MPKFRKIAAGVAALTLAGVGFPAGAQQVPVNLENPAGTRVLHVEDMTGTQLASLDFGTQRTLPFRIRVVDSNFSRTGFTVNASMSNLYKHTNGTIGDYTKKIPSSEITLGSQLNPVNALDVKAVVQPLVDTVTTLTGADALLCTTLGIATSLINGVTGCQLSTDDLVGKVQTLTTSVSLPLSDLPLVPQSPESGNFATAEYSVGVGAGDTAGAGAAGSQRKLIGGLRSETLTSGLVNDLTALLDVNPRSDLIDDSTIVAGLSAVNGLVATLTSSQITTLLNNTVATVNTLTGTNILSVFGTYVSLPTLSVNVPSGTDPGSYRGTLVVTGIQ
ncbi:MAG TPA: hypothetical protein VM345_06370 [Acidimicrobiales bacterium]|jgi:hypothetical protein|nr:hypothetical protein [Acidimicrobiales bacterium]